MKPLCIAGALVIALTFGAPLALVQSGGHVSDRTDVATSQPLG
jgi:hypothetical protein